MKRFIFHNRIICASLVFSIKEIRATLAFLSFNLSNGLNNQRGVAFIELLVALSIGSLIAVSASNTIFQMFTVNDMSFSRMYAVKQLENAIYLISRDSQMAQLIQTTGPTGFPLTISWVTWDNISYSVSYNINGSEVSRRESVNGGTPSVMVVARDVVGSAADTNCQFTDGVLRVMMAVSVKTGSHTSTEVRSLNISPRQVS
jgi:prepilin-type N-terminal cleavage/methylation domain-containing protein